MPPETTTQPPNQLAKNSGEQKSIAVNRPGTAGTIRDFLMGDRQMAILNSVATKYVTPEKMIKIVCGIMSRNPKLAKCTPLSVLNCCLDAAALGLTPVLGRCHFVPFKNGMLSKEAGVDVLECQMIIGYQGLCDLMRRSGEIRAISAEVVRQGDIFHYRLGSDPTIEHEIKSADGPMTHAYAIAHFKDGGMPQMVVMNRVQVEAIKQKSKGAWDYNGNPKKDSPWHDPNFEQEMWKKTAIRRMSKYAPMAVEELTTAMEKTAEHPNFGFTGLREIVDGESGEVDGDERPPAGVDPDAGNGGGATSLAEEAQRQVREAEAKSKGEKPADANAKTTAATPDQEARREKFARQAEDLKRKPCARGQEGCSTDEGDFSLVDGVMRCANHATKSEEPSSGTLPGMDAKSGRKK